MAKVKEGAPVHVAVHKLTSIGSGKLKTSSMNKSRRRAYKRYKGQGR